MELLRDPAVATILTVLGIVLALWLWWRNAKKSLTCTVLSNESLNMTDEAHAVGARVSVGGTVLDDPRLVKLRIRNTGIEMLTESEFRGPIRVGFGAGVRVVSVLVEDASTSQLREAVRHDERHVLLAPVLLNRNAFLVLKVLVEGGDATVTTDACIEKLDDGVVVRNLTERQDPTICPEFRGKCEMA